jgi:DNA repair exonuclease SbcCD ATPase subunit
MNWLRDHMRDHLGKANSITFDNVATLSRAPTTTKDPPPSALDLADQAVAVISKIRDRAEETEIYAQALAESAIEKLRQGEERIQSAEAERDAALQELSKVNRKLGGVQEELIQGRSRLASVDAQLKKAEEQLRAAEIRAINAEKAVRLIEQAIRMQLVEPNKNMRQRAFTA